MSLLHDSQVFFFKYFLKNSFMYLVAPALSCACGIFSCNMRDLVPHQTQGCLHWDCGVLATGPQGSSLMVKSLQMQPFFTPWPLVFSQIPLFFLPSFSILSNFHQEWSNNPRVLGNGSQCLTIHCDHPGRFTNY